MSGASVCLVRPVGRWSDTRAGIACCESLAVRLGLTLRLGFLLRKLCIGKRGSLAHIRGTLHRYTDVAGPDSLEIGVSPRRFWRSPCFVLGGGNHGGCRYYKPNKRGTSPDHNCLPLVSWRIQQSFRFRK